VAPALASLCESGFDDGWLVHRTEDIAGSLMCAEQDVDADPEFAILTASLVEV
jgi:hypothetical protein